MPKLDNYLRYATMLGASDLHITVGSPPIMRLHGALKPLKANPLTAQETLSLIGEILSKQQQQFFTGNLDLDFCYEASGIGSFRANVLKQRNGVDAVFRIIPVQVQALDELGFPRPIKNLTHHHNGLILVTGSVGSGKSTTLAAMIDYINEQRQLHIITVEDPIEFIHTNKRCNISQREVKNHTETFSIALRSALREDPDVILIGEMRDLETISMAITAAETGHLVFGTLHTRNAAKTVDRIIDAFPPAQQNQVRIMLSESLRGVISQQLIPRIDGNGRVLAYELLVGTAAVSNLIRESKTFQIPTLMQISSKDGMVLMDQSLAKLAASGVITTEEAFLRAENRKTLSQFIAASQKGQSNGAN